jgi:DNA (cytosine-5)-methyltransferase 1
LESEDYACGAVGIPAAGVGAPHIRQRLWFVANNNNNKRREWDSRVGRDTQWGAEHAGDAGELADANNERCSEQHALLRPEEAGRHESGILEIAGRGESGELANTFGSNEQQRSKDVRKTQFIGRSSTDSELADTDREQRGQRLQPVPRGFSERAGGGHIVSDVANTSDDRPQRRLSRWADAERQTFDGPIGRDSSDCRTRQVNNFWGATDWLHCRDEKWRPVEPGTFPLAHGPTARVGRLRAYGNAIVPQVAQALIEAYLSCN